MNTKNFNILKGFNTYNSNNLLSHVLLPHCFSLNLAFKFYNTGRIIKDALVGFDDITPKTRSYDGTYTELVLSCSDNEILIESTVIDDNQFLLITPIKITKKPPALLIYAAVLWNKQGNIENKDNCLFIDMQGKKIKVMTDGTPINEMNTFLTNPYLAVELSGAVAVSTDIPITAAELKKIMSEKKQGLKNELLSYGELSEVYNAMRSCLAWNMIYEPEKDRICTPVSRGWSRNWGGYVLFCWDTYFAALMASVENKELAYANLIAITEEKTEMGFVPNVAASNDIKTRDRSQPPVGAFVLKEIYIKYKETDIVKYLFDDLLEWNRWFSNHRRLENGQLAWGSDPYENLYEHYCETGGVDKINGAALESGLDNSPMYDDIPFDKEKHIMCLADAGLTGLYIMDCEALADMAELIGRNEEALELKQRAEHSKNGLEELWDEEFGMYLNKRTDTNEFSRRISPTNFYALFSDKITAEHAQRMINEHFLNEEEFFGEYMMPSIARNDTAYKEQDYWRGCIWAPMNYLAYVAMKKHKLSDACRLLAEKSKKLLLLEWNLHGHVHENYNADTGMGCSIGPSDKFYHWGGLLSLIALTEEGYAGDPWQP